MEQQHQREFIKSGGGGTANAAAARSGGGGVSAPGSSTSTARWIPTSEQIRILRDLYYNCGLRSPNGEQIQRISAKLRQFGKIEGKNVFYWFQNHKARERQKRKLLAQDQQHLQLLAAAGHTSTKDTTSPAPPTSSSTVLPAAAPAAGDYYASSSSLMQQVAPAAPWHIVSTMIQMHHEQHHQYSYVDASAAAAAAGDVETLQLFPVHSTTQQMDDHDQLQLQVAAAGSCMFPANGAVYDFFPPHDDAAASLELTLNSTYCCCFP